LKLEEFDSGGGPVRIHVRSTIVSCEQVNDTQEISQLSSKWVSKRSLCIQEWREFLF